jgi:hypothetical protein
MVTGPPNFVAVKVALNVTLISAQSYLALFFLEDHI